MILVFAGAGSSAAVDPKQYPTTAEFFNRLPDNIKQDPLFSQVHEFLATQKGEQPIDIEEILWTLDELRDYSKASLNTETISGWILAESRVNRVIANVPNLSNLRRGMRHLEQTQIETLKHKINVLVYAFYATIPSDDKLSDWVRLLQGLTEHELPVEIFTTNYDRVLETAIKEGKINVETGRRPDDVQPIQDMAIWDNPGRPLTRKRGRLTKLHGSVDWQRNQEGTIIRTGSDLENEEHLILYPGYKGVPGEEPFVKFHEHLRAVVQQANAAIFIGYAFRDRHINTILSELPSKISKLVINKDDALPEGPDFSFLNGCQHLNDGLTEESVNICLQSLYMKLGQKAPMLRARKRASGR